MNVRNLPQLKLQLNEQSELNPLNIHQLMFQEKIYMPLITTEKMERNIHPLIFRLMRVKHTERLIVYIMSDADLYFFYKIQLNTEDIRELNEKYQLCLKRLSDFVEFFKYSLEEIQNHQKQGVLELQQEYSKEITVFVLKKIVSGKIYTVMELKGEKESEELITEYVAYKYGHIQDRIHQKESKIQELRELIRFTNPNPNPNPKPL